MQHPYARQESDQSDMSTQSQKRFIAPQPAQQPHAGFAQPSAPSGSQAYAPNYSATAPGGPSTAPAAPHHRHGIMQETEEELTADELAEYEKGVITWDKVKNWRYWVRKEWWYWYIILLVIVVVVALMVFFHHSIINWLTPVVNRFKTLKAGFLIPAALLIVVSFPPLFGAEIIMILVGVVWGLGKGFAIVTVGVIIGECANYFAFKYWCRARAERMTKKSLNYACLSQAIVEGGFLMAWIVRLSVIPTHFTTAVFAVCGLKFWQYFIALILGLPKQLLAVYVGVVLAEQNASTNSHVVSDCVFAASAVVTLGALWFIYKRMLGVRKKVIIGMRDDLDRKGVHPQVSPTEEQLNSAPNDVKSWHNPWAQPAVTNPAQGQD